MISTYSRSLFSRDSRSRASRQGFSLIEVAIALVIFVIGALAIIRIFPGALSVIGNNGDQQVATNLNRTMLVGLQSNQVTATPTPGPPPLFPAEATARISFNAVPRETFNNSNADGTLSINTWTLPNAGVDHTDDFKNSDSSVIGIPRFNLTLPTTQDIETGTSNSSLSRYRAILGEKALITGLTVGASSNKYVLTQFPVSVQAQGSPAVLLPVKPVLSQEYALNDVRIKPNGILDFTRSYVDKLNDITSPLGVNAHSALYISYRYYDSSSKVWSVNDEFYSLALGNPNLRPNTAVQVRPPTNAVKRDAARTTSGVLTDAIIPEIVQVKLRSFVGQGEFGPVAATPLEQIADARRGLVRLPTGIDDTKPILLDYVADWSFLLQDGSPSISPLITTDTGYPALPTTPTDLSYRQLALGTPFIEDQAPVSVYSLLIDSNAAYPSAYGEVSPDPPAIDRLVRPTQPQQRDEELRSGKVTFIVESSAARARVAYQTRANWVQQLSVAANFYTPFVAGGALSVEPWRNYYLGDDNYLYFHAGEAGKTINLSYSYNDVSDTPPHPPIADKVIVDRPFTIEDKLLTAPNFLVTSGFAVTGEQVARVELQTSQGEDFPASKFTAVINLTSIQAIKGVSVTARTAYINGTKYAQTLLTSNRGAL